MPLFANDSNVAEFRLSTLLTNKELMEFESIAFLRKLLLRRRYNLTVRDIAEVTGVSRTIISALQSEYLRDSKSIEALTKFLEEDQKQ